MANPISSNYNAHKLRRLMGTHVEFSNFQNIVYSPDVGQIWLFDDKELERKIIQWEIVATLPGSAGIVRMKKLTGREVAYTTEVERSALQDNENWRLHSGPITTQTIVTFNCPGCHEPNPIEIGDYLCVTCRKVP